MFQFLSYYPPFLRVLLMTISIILSSAIPAQDAGISESTLEEQLEQLVPQLLEAYAVPGTDIGMISREGITKHVYGFAEPNAGVSVTTETAFIYNGLNFALNI